MMTSASDPLAARLMRRRMMKKGAISPWTGSRSSPNTAPNTIALQTSFGSSIPASSRSHGDAARSASSERPPGRNERGVLDRDAQSGGEGGDGRPDPQPVQTSLVRRRHDVSLRVAPKSGIRPESGSALPPGADGETRRSSDAAGTRLPYRRRHDAQRIPRATPICSCVPSLHPPSARRRARASSTSSSSPPGPSSSTGTSSSSPSTPSGRSSSAGGPSP